MNLAKHRARGAQGFTLLEVLLAVVVFAIVLTAINSVMVTGMRVRTVTVNAIERAEPLERTIAVMRHDLANIVLPGGTISGTFQTTSVINNTLPDGTTGANGPQQGAMMNMVPASMPGQSSPLFYVANGIVDETTPWADIEQIFYYLAPPTNSATRGMDLYRAMTSNLLPIMPEQPMDQYLMSGIQEINFYYYSVSATSTGQWLDYWDSTTTDQSSLQTNNVPRAIKVVMQLASGGNPVVFVVPTWVQASTNQSSAVSTNSI